MEPYFLNWDEALDFMLGSTDWRVLGALSELNRGIQCCVGLPVGEMTDTRLPDRPLDLLWFYQVVSGIMSGWDEEGDPWDDGGRDARVGTMTHGMDGPGQRDLLKFHHRFMCVPLAGECDVSFCVWLFSRTILLPGILPRVLDGSVGDDVAGHAELSSDEWAALWV